MPEIGDAIKKTYDIGNVDTWPRNLPSVFGRNPLQYVTDLLWIKMTVFIMTSQNQIARNRGGVNVENLRQHETLWFLAPMNLQENINHTWDAYDAIASRAAQKIGGLEKVGKDLLNLLGTVFTKGPSRALESPIVKKKVDTPLTYQDSERREVTFTFELMDQGDPYVDIFLPVNKMREYSSPELNNDLVDFDFPYIFSLRTHARTQENDLINFKYAALTSVQPSYIGPYRNGYPMKCELTLTFKDLAPLYRSSFRSGTAKVTSSESTEAGTGRTEVNATTGGEREGGIGLGEFITGNRG